MSYRLQAPAAIAISALLGACQSTTAPAIQSASTELRSAPTSAILAGQGLHVDATIWRDFMPSSPPDGKPLIVIARIQADNGATVSGAVTADSLWVRARQQAPASRSSLGTGRSGDRAYQSMSSYGFAMGVEALRMFGQSINSSAARTDGVRPPPNESLPRPEARIVHHWRIARTLRLGS